jgi:ubiquinone biosynthesis protein
MKNSIQSIPQIYRNVRRWTEIISVLSKYGLADWISRLNIDFVKDHLKSPDGEALARQSHETRMRLAMTELGPTYMKLGQLLSTRPDVIGWPLANELQSLQSQTPADNYESVKGKIESELKKPIHELFPHFEETPLASASIGQVHFARLATGEPVVVKVQHRDIKKRIEDDLEILIGVAQLAEKIEDFRHTRPVRLAEEMARTMRRELDFRRELRNLMQFHHKYEKHAKIRIPRPYPDLCSASVLTMEFISGTPLSDIDSLRDQDVDLHEIARCGADAYLRMIFEMGFFHADPHPGNILICPDQRIAILDFGMVGRISEKLREDIEEMLLAIVNNDVTTLVSIIRRVGEVPSTLDELALSRDVADFVGQYSTQSIKHFDLSSALNDMTRMIQQHHISLPSEAALLIKVLVTLEGSARIISPEISLMEVMVPLHRGLVLRRFSPLRQMKKMQKIGAQLEQFAETAPQRINNIIEQLQTGKFDIHLDHRRLGPSVNRLVLGIMTSAMFLGSSWMLSNKVAPLLFPGDPWFGIKDLSVIGLGGMLFSLMTGARLVWAIRKSGNLDRGEDS